MLWRVITLKNKSCKISTSSVACATLRPHLSFLLSCFVKCVISWLIVVTLIWLAINIKKHDMRCKCLLALLDPRDWRTHTHTRNHYFNSSNTFWLREWLLPTVHMRTCWRRHAEVQSQRQNVEEVETWRRRRCLNSPKSNSDTKKVSLWKSSRACSMFQCKMKRI